MTDEADSGERTGLVSPVAYQGAPAGHGDYRLAAIFEIARILAIEHDLPAILEKFLGSLVQTFAVADAGMLFLADPDDGLALRACIGYDANHVEAPRSLPG